MAEPNDRPEIEGQFADPGCRTTERRTGDGRLLPAKPPLPFVARLLRIFTHARQAIAAPIDDHDRRNGGGWSMD